MNTPSTYSLRSEFRARATPAELAARRASKAEADRRTESNRVALGNWANESRGKTFEVPQPQRRTH